MCLVAFFIQQAEHAIGFLEQLHGFGSLASFFFGKAYQPHGTACIASMDVCNAGITGLESPRMEEVHPIDVLAYLVDVVLDNHRQNVNACPRWLVST